MRLFAAIRPPERVLDHLARTLAAVAEGPADTAAAGRGPGPVRWTVRENWHLTLAFYGDVPDGAVDEVADRLAGVAAMTEPFELSLRGSGLFAGRTLWIGAGGQVAAAAALSSAATEAGSEVTGWRDDRVRARPHLTIGRVAPTARETTRRRRGRSTLHRAASDAAAGGLVRALAVYTGPSWQVEDLLLVSSEPGAGRSGGPRYTDVAVCVLGRAAAS